MENNAVGILGKYQSKLPCKQLQRYMRNHHIQVLKGL